jgi:hypothetical protein
MSSNQTLKISSGDCKYIQTKTCSRLYYSCSKEHFSILNNISKILFNYFIAEDDEFFNRSGMAITETSKTKEG